MDTGKFPGNGEGGVRIITVFQKRGPLAFFKKNHFLGPGRAKGLYHVNLIPQQFFFSGERGGVAPNSPLFFPLRSVHAYWVVSNAI